MDRRQQSVQRQRDDGRRDADADDRDEQAEESLGGTVRMLAVMVIARFPAHSVRYV